MAGSDSKLITRIRVRSWPLVFTQNCHQKVINVTFIKFWKKKKKKITVRVLFFVYKFTGSEFENH